MVFTEGFTGNALLQTHVSIRHSPTKRCFLNPSRRERGDKPCRGCVDFDMHTVDRHPRTVIRQISGRFYKRRLLKGSTRPPDDEVCRLFGVLRADGTVCIGFAHYDSRCADGTFQLLSMDQFLQVRDSQHLFQHARLLSYTRDKKKEPPFLLAEPGEWETLPTATHILPTMVDHEVDTGYRIWTTTDKSGTPKPEDLVPDMNEIKGWLESSRDAGKFVDTVHRYDYPVSSSLY